MSGWAHECYDGVGGIFNRGIGGGDGGTGCAEGMLIDGFEPRSIGIKIAGDAEAFEMSVRMRPGGIGGLGGGGL